MFTNKAETAVMLVERPSACLYFLLRRRKHLAMSKSPGAFRAMETKEQGLGNIPGLGHQCQSEKVRTKCQGPTLQGLGLYLLYTKDLMARRKDLWQDGLVLKFTFRMQRALKGEGFTDA